MRELAFSREDEGFTVSPQTKKKPKRNPEEQNDSNELKEKKGRILMKINLSVEYSAIMSKKVQSWREPIYRKGPPADSRFVRTRMLHMCHLRIASCALSFGFQAPVAVPFFVGLHSKFLLFHSNAPFSYSNWRKSSEISTLIAKRVFVRFYLLPIHFR